MLEDRDRLIGLHLQALAVLDYKPPTTGDADDVIALITAGELLTLDQAADAAECSDETIRRACELSAATSSPIGVKLAGAGWSAKRGYSTTSRRGGSAAVNRTRGSARRHGQRSTRVGRGHSSRSTWRKAHAR